MPDLMNASMLLYGPPGIGKSTFGAELDDSLMLDLEGGLTWMDGVASKAVENWRAFKSVVELIRKGGKVPTEQGGAIKPKHVVVDTVDILWMFCNDYICKKHGFEHPSDESFGKGYQVLRYEFQRELALLNQWKVGKVFLSHAQVVEQRGRGNNTTKKIMPSLPGSAQKVLIPMVDILAYAGQDVVDQTIVGDRAMIFHPQEDLEAKDRTRRLPRILELSAQAMHDALRSQPRRIVKTSTQTASVKGVNAKLKKPIKLVGRKK